MTYISILIPSYKRPKVLDLTIKNLLENMRSEGFKISIAIGLLKVDDEARNVAHKYDAKFIDKGIEYNVLEYDTNIGKAACLNDLYDRFKKDSGYIISLDNDMVIRKPWLHLIDEIKTIDFDVMGFGSSTFWAHDPRREDCKIVQVKIPYTYYMPISIAGGMMVISREFMSSYRWTNHGGVYGRDDQDICLRTRKKYVIMWPVDWLEHDPLCLLIYQLLNI